MKYLLKVGDQQGLINIHGWRGNDKNLCENLLLTQFIFLERLVYDGQFHCGGSLLTQDYVLTVNLILTTAGVY